jgi:hypothetical protein
MDVFTEYALLFVVAAPLAFATVAHLVCMAAGERDTLILPTVADFHT